METPTENTILGKITSDGRDILQLADESGFVYFWIDSKGCSRRRIKAETETKSNE